MSQANIPNRLFDGAAAEPSDSAVRGAAPEAWSRPTRARSVGAQRMADAPYEGDLHLLDGPGWWHPWAAGLALLAVPAVIKLIPGRPWWEFAPGFVLIAVGIVFAWRGWQAGNPVQKACCALLALLLVALAARLGDWAIGIHIQTGPLVEMDKSLEV